MKSFCLFPILLLSGFLAAQPTIDTLFPGDANDDGRADALDLLAIGLAYGAEGPPRLNPGSDWAPEFFVTWPNALPVSGVNFGYIDTNGDGFIDSLDADLIAFHYDSAQTLTQTQPYAPDSLLEVPEPPFLSVHFAVDTVNILDTLIAELRFLANPSQFPGALGAFVRLTYDPVNVRDSLTRVRFDTLATDRMGLGGAFRHVTLQRGPPSGAVEIAVAGRGENILNGPQLLAEVEFIIQEVILRQDTAVHAPFWLDFDAVLLLDAGEAQYVVATFSDTVILRQPATSLRPTAGAAPACRLSPNPARDRVRVELSPPDLRPLAAALHDPRGAVVWSARAPDLPLEIPLRHRPPGLYRVEIRTERGICARKLLHVP
jgi:hypothetical protein